MMGKMLSAEDKDAIAMGITLEKAVYGVSYTEEDGTTDYFYTVGSDTYFMVFVSAGADGGAICARVSAVPEPAE